MNSKQNFIKLRRNSVYFLEAYEYRLQEFSLMDSIYSELTLKGRNYHNKNKTWLENNLYKYLEFLEMEH